jgi:small subunit ribosomal protein S4
MGDPKKIRKKYKTPAHPWEKARLEHEAELIKKYALGNKKEIWKINSLLKSFKAQAKKLGSLSTKQAEKERNLVLAKLTSIGLLKAEDTLESVLTVAIEDLMERRLQTFVLKKGFARTMKQARQFVTHGHIQVSGKVITSPSYILRVSEEDGLTFKTTSSLSDPDNPERKITKEVPEKKETKSEKKEKSE